ncbi:MAG: o-succinylbenzoate synthase [Alicyclobacillaceae bacterium]|nr:o-succinylbenzoate synthase [Alicyclobacillaceae bacterium]
MSGMSVREVVVRRLNLPMREPFETSFGRETDKDVLVVEVHTDAGHIGYSECVAMASPVYNEETTGTAWQMLSDFFVNQLWDQSFHEREDLFLVRDRLQPFRKNQMAKAALEMAVWDAYAAEYSVPLFELLGGVRREVPVGISVGIQASTRRLVEKVEGYLEQGFQRVKVKVRPGYDEEPLSALRREFPGLLLMADANSAYTLSDVPLLKTWDRFHLMMVEQPLGYDDLVDHATLQAAIDTPVCLDESIHSAADVRKTAKIKAGKVINLKLGRVGGFAEAIAIHDACAEYGLDLWCGGMLETGIGRLHNIAITSLPGFNLPGDTAPSARYFTEDIIEPAVEFSTPGNLAVEPLCGVHSRVDRDRLEHWTVDKRTLRQGESS